jgi:hypothetical protein
VTDLLHDDAELMPSLEALTALVSADIGAAAQILAEAGFPTPTGHEAVGDDDRDIARWNLAYAAAAKAWADQDDWQSVGLLPRLAADLIEAGVALQLAALAAKEGIGGVAAVVTCISSGTVFGALRAHIQRWSEPGALESLQRQRDVEQEIAGSIASLGGRARAAQRTLWYPEGKRVCQQARSANPAASTAELVRKLKRHFRVVIDMPREERPPEHRDLPTTDGGWTKAINGWEREGELTKRSSAGSSEPASGNPEQA